MVELANRHRHSIRLLTEVGAVPAAERFNCHTYALDLYESPEVRQHWTRLVFPNADFMRSLVATMLTERDGRDDDTLVVYYLAGGIEHSGRQWDGRVRSKWGNGHIWEHALHEVPLSYGDTVRFFRPPAREEAVAAYVAFARSVDPFLRRF
jgi:hypothetical protein